MLRAPRSVLALGLVLGLSSPLSAAPVFIDFESFLEGDGVGGLVGPEVMFSSAMVLTAGSLLNEIDFPPHSGTNVVFDNGSPMRLDFAVPILSFSGYFTYAAPITIQFFDASSNLLGIVASAFADNTAGGGGLSNELLFGAFAGTSFVTISGSPLGGSFVLDDLAFDTMSVPEPSAVALIASGLALMTLLRRRASHGSRHL